MHVRHLLMKRRQMMRWYHIFLFLKIVLGNILLLIKSLLLMICENNTSTKVVIKSLAKYNWICYIQLNNRLSELDCHKWTTTCKSLTHYYCAKLRYLFGNCSCYTKIDISRPRYLLYKYIILIIYAICLVRDYTLSA